MAMFTSLSAVTWVPCLLLFVYQCYSSPQPWAMATFPSPAALRGSGDLDRIPVDSRLGSFFLGQVAGRGHRRIFAAVFVPAGVGAIVSAVLRTNGGCCSTFQL
jgi:hypothetical protein